MVAGSYLLLKLTPHGLHSVCFEHQAVPKSIAMNVGKPKGKILKIFKVHVHIER